MKSIMPPATSPMNQAQARFNEDALSDKVSETGFNFFYTGGLLGEIGTAPVLIPQWRPILVVNTNAAIQYVAMSDNPLMVAPAGGATGIPIAANGGRMVLSSGPNSYIFSSSVDLFAYAANDNVVDQPEGNLHG